MCAAVFWLHTWAFTFLLKFWRTCVYLFVILERTQPCAPRCHHQSGTQTDAPPWSCTVPYSRTVSAGWSNFFLCSCFRNFAAGLSGRLGAFFSRLTTFILLYVFFRSSTSRASSLTAPRSLRISCMENVKTTEIRSTSSGFVYLNNVKTKTYVNSSMYVMSRQLNAKCCVVRSLAWLLDSSNLDVFFIWFLFSSDATFWLQLLVGCRMWWDRASSDSRDASAWSLTSPIVCSTCFLNPRFARFV